MTDALDAETFVPPLPCFASYDHPQLKLNQASEPFRAQRPARAVRERRRNGRRPDQIQLRLGSQLLPLQTKKLPSKQRNEKNSQEATPQKQGLVKSNNRNDQQLGVRLLSDIFRVSPERRRECLYYLALGNYKLGNYGEARRYNDLLLEKEPANLQATDLRQLIDDKVAKEGLLGVAIVSGIGIAAGVVGAFLLRNAKRR